MKIKKKKYYVIKKTFQLNANHPLFNNMGYIINKIEHVWGGRVGLYTWEARPGALYRRVGPL